MNSNILSSLHKADTSEGPSQTGSLDPEIQTYFFVNRNTAPHDSESVPVSPRFSKSRALSYEKTPRSGTSRRSRKSGESKRSNRAKTGSLDSSPSLSSPYQRVADRHLMSASDTRPFSSQGTNRTSVDPPRPPIPGFEWVWFPEGYWAERERPGISASKQGTKQKWWNRSPGPQSKPSRHTDANKTHHNLDVPKIKFGRIVSRRASSLNRRKSENDSQKSSKPLVGPTTPPSFLVGPREGLYCKAKRNIKEQLFQQPKTGLDDTSMEFKDGRASRTTMLLEGTSSYFGKLQRDRAQLQQHQLSRVGTPQSPTSTLDGRPRRRFGLAPWHRRNSHESLLSVSSSVHGLLRGKTPAATPDFDCRYTGSDGKEYQPVDISGRDPREPTFLPSEAMRIHTPPMSESTPNIQTRGFFFDLSPATTDDGKSDAEGLSPNRSANTSMSSNGMPRSRTGQKTAREWWSAATKHREKGNKSTGKSPRSPLKGQTEISAFELNLPPEHLPNSPLCPKNPKHPSGGSAICVYHGRRRSVGLETLKRVSTDPTEDSDAAQNGY